MVDSKIFFYISKNLYVTKDTAGTFIITAILFYLFFILGFMISKGLDYELKKLAEKRNYFFEKYLHI